MDGTVLAAGQQVPHFPGGGAGHIREAARYFDR